MGRVLPGRVISWRRRWLRRVSRSISTLLVVLVVVHVVPLAGAGAGDDVVASDGLIAIGDAGALVADLQSFLTETGHDPGPIDGDFGPLTDQAVRAFQLEAGLSPDGVVGARTRAAIAARITEDITPTSTAPDGAPTLSAGASGPAVTRLQRELARTHLYRGPIDGVFGPATSSAVIAFHKARNLERSSTWSSGDWARIADWDPSAPGWGDAPTRVEIDLTRQLLFFVEAHEVTAVMPVSTGNGELYTTTSGQRVPARTPTGDFTVFRNVDGWDVSYLGELFEPWYFSGGYAVHGSWSVPPYPASHGCVRVRIADALWLDTRMFIGIPVHVR